MIYENYSLSRYCLKILPKRRSATVLVRRTEERKKKKRSTTGAGQNQQPAAGTTAPPEKMWRSATAFVQRRESLITGAGPKAGITALRGKTL